MIYSVPKRGGGNFGVITRYDVLVYPGGPVAGGEIIIPENQTEKWLDMVYDYSTRQAVVDVKTHALPAIAYVAANNLVVGETIVYYNDHNSSKLPPVMSGWTNMTMIGNTVRQASYASLAAEYAVGFNDGQL